MPTVREIVEAFDRDNQPDPTTHRICVEREEKLREQVKLLRAACEAALALRFAPHETRERIVKQIHAALAATEPKEQPK